GPVLFVITYAIAGVNTAAAVAVGVSVVLMIERLIRGKSAVNAVGGLLGTGLAAFIALRTGRPEGYFVPRMLYQLALAVVFAGSGPRLGALVGFTVASLCGADAGWAEPRPVRRTMIELTLAWAALFAVRGGVYAVLIAAGKAGWLGGAPIVMGWPAFALLIFGSFRYGPRRLAQLGAPPPRRAQTP